MVPGAGAVAAERHTHHGRRHMGRWLHPRRAAAAQAAPARPHRDPAARNDYRTARHAPLGYLASDGAIAGPPALHP